MNVTHLECGLCGTNTRHGGCSTYVRNAEKPLLVRYDLEQAARTLTKESMPSRRAESVALSGSAAGR